MPAEEEEEANPLLVTTPHLPPAGPSKGMLIFRLVAAALAVVGVALGVVLLLGDRAPADKGRATASVPVSPTGSKRIPEVATEPPTPPEGQGEPGPTLVDPCQDLPDGQHVDRQGKEPIAARTCEGGVSVGFCDIELTRTERRLTLERCKTVTRKMTMSSDFLNGGWVSIRVGGTLPGIDLALVDVGGKLTLKSTSKFLIHLSGTFEPEPDQVLEIMRASNLESELGPMRTETPSGGSFRLRTHGNSVVLDDYRPPPGGRKYKPVRVEPKPNGQGSRRSAR